MPRKKSLTDAQVLADARRLHLSGGEKALTFGNLARASGLAASTLAQRFGTIEGLIAALARQGWQDLLEALTAIEAATADKGPQGYLKALSPSGLDATRLLSLSTTDEAARQLAEDWRARVVTALALRLGQGEKARAAAAVLFTHWQGQLLWGNGSGAAEMKLKEIAKKLI